MKNNMNMIQSSQRISCQCRQISSQWSICSENEYSVHIAGEKRDVISI